MTEHLCEMPIHTFLERVAAATPAPGGGSVAAAAGAMGASLIEMVASLSLPKTSEENRPKLESIRDQAHQLRNELCSLIDHDSLAYQGVVAAYKLPKDQPDRKAVAIDNGMDFCAQSATRTADGVIRAPFFPPAAC